MNALALATVPDVATVASAPAASPAQVPSLADGPVRRGDWNWRASWIPDVCAALGTTGSPPILAGYRPGMRKWRVRKGPGAVPRLQSLLRCDPTTLNCLVSMAGLSAAEIASMSGCGGGLSSGDDSSSGGDSPIADYLDAYFRRAAEERKVFFFSPVLVGSSATAGIADSVREDIPPADAEAYATSVAMCFNTGLRAVDGREEILLLAALHKDFKPSTSGHRFYLLGFTTASRMVDQTDDMGIIPRDGFPAMNRIAMSATTTNVITMAQAVAHFGAVQDHGHASGKHSTTLRFRWPERTRRAVCFDGGDVRRTPPRIDVWTGLPLPLVVLHPALPLLSAEGAPPLDVLPLLGIDAAEARRTLRNDAGAEAALQELVLAVRAAAADAIITAGTHSHLYALPRTANEARLVLLMPLVLSAAHAPYGLRAVAALALVPRPGAAAPMIGDDGSSASSLRNLAYALYGVMTYSHARTLARVVQPLTGTWLQEPAGDALSGASSPRSSAAPTLAPVRTPSPAPAPALARAAPPAPAPAPAPAAESEVLMSKRVVARVVKVKQPPAPVGGTPASEYKLEIVDDECINFLLSMARPGESSKALATLAEKRVLYLRWELATFFTSAGTPIKVADREPELRRVAERGGNVIVTVDSACNTGNWAFQVTVVQV